MFNFIRKCRSQNYFIFFSYVSELSEHFEMTHEKRCQISVAHEERWHISVAHEKRQNRHQKSSKAKYQINTGDIFLDICQSGFKTHKNSRNEHFLFLCLDRIIARYFQSIILKTWQVATITNGELHFHPGFVFRLTYFWRYNHQHEKIRPWTVKKFLQEYR